MSDPDMLALVVRGPKEHALERIPMPVPAPGEALVAVTHVAVCGTDLRLLRGTLHDADYPVIPGHEWTGRVLEAPDRPELVGKTVVGDGITPCRQCERCAEGGYNLCQDLDEVGFTRPGAFAEAFTIPAANLQLLPDTLSGAEGCLLEPLCVALHAVERAPDVSGRSVGVIGAGTIGLLVGQLALAAGAQSVTVAEPEERRRRLATELGLDQVSSLAELGKALPEIVFDATGVASVFPDGLEATRPGGAYVLVGYSGEEPTHFEPSAVMLREVTVYGVLSGYGQLDKALDMVVNGTVRLMPLLDEELPMSDYRSVLEDRGGDAPLRTVFTTGAGQTV
ncbi:zinc-dependent alcohol dehydrogenase family protein [Streptomyces sannanensis]|uniref:2-deoxy-scyllo-inosamine dehydrogenase n=1 Tax=Streptomyces sannanensis TaxID=285536 RepID=A0ABP6SC94_9ACTN